MSRDLAAQVGRAVGVRSGTKVRELDNALRAYSRLTPRAAGVPVEGEIPWMNVTGKPTVFAPDPGAVQGLTAVIAPAALASGSTHDWSPTDLAVANVLRATTDAAGSTLTGLVPPAAGRLLALFNLGPATLTLAHDAGSTAVNRFFLPGAVDLALGIHAGVRLWYDATSERWRALVY